MYRLGHPLAEQVLQQAKSRELPAAEIIFDYSGYGSKISVLEPYLGHSGELLLSLFTVESLDQAEDYLLFAAAAKSGHVLEEDAVRRLLSLPAILVTPLTDAIFTDNLQEIAQRKSRYSTRYLGTERQIFRGGSREARRLGRRSENSTRT